MNSSLLASIRVLLRISLSRILFCSVMFCCSTFLNAFTLNEIYDRVDKLENKVITTGETGYVVAQFNTRAFNGSRSATLTATIAFNNKKGHKSYGEVQVRVWGTIRSDIVFPSPHGHHAPYAITNSPGRVTRSLWVFLKPPSESAIARTLGGILSSDAAPHCDTKYLSQIASICGTRSGGNVARKAPI